MRDERKIIVNPECDPNAEEGFGKVFGIIFWVVMVIGVIDR